MKSVKRAYSAPELNPKKSKKATLQPANTLLNYFQLTNRPDEMQKDLKKHFSLTDFFKSELKVDSEKDYLSIIAEDENETDKVLVAAEIKTQAVLTDEKNAFDLLLRKGSKEKDENVRVDEIRPNRKCPFYKRIEGKGDLVELY